MERFQQQEEEQHQTKEEEGSDSGSDNGDEAEVVSSSDVDEDSWPEECHVLAPCTHNGTCPMSRHQRHHIKKNARFGKYEATIEQNDGEDVAYREEETSEAEIVDENEDEDEDEEEEQGDLQDLLNEWDDFTDEEKDQIKMMLGGNESMSDEEAKIMMQYMDGIDEDDLDDDEEQEEEEDSDSDDDEDDRDFYHVEEKTKDPSTMATTDVFDTSFCSFVHNFPGGTSRKKGEKFTYLVLQKRLAADSMIPSTAATEEQDALDVDVVEMLSKSVHHTQKVKLEEIQKLLDQKRIEANGHDGEENPTFDTYHRNQAHDVLQKAVEVEDQFLDSKVDRLGLEMIVGDERRKGWGRLIRAPLKRKGHVIVDYCSAGCGGYTNCSKSRSNESVQTDGSGAPNRTQGRITRQKVSRGWSARSAPGCYSAARKARWGGLWPDLSERVKLAGGR